MTRVSPPELERALPGPHESIRSTRAPSPRRCRAVQPPKAPAPTTATRGLEPGARVWAQRRPARGTAATHSRNVRRVTPSITPREAGAGSETHTCTDTDCAWLIGQIADACTRSALLIQCQKCPLVTDVVDVECRVPAVLQDSDPQVHDVIGRQLRVEGKRVLCERPTDVVGCERGQSHGPEAGRLVADLRETIADVLVDPRGVAGHTLIHGPVEGGGAGHLELWNGRQPVTGLDACHDADVSKRVGGGERRLQLGSDLAGGHCKVEHVARRELELPFQAAGLRLRNVEHEA